MRRLNHTRRALRISESLAILQQRPQSNRPQRPAGTAKKGAPRLLLSSKLSQFQPHADILHPGRGMHLKSSLPPNGPLFLAAIDSSRSGLRA